MAKLAKSAPSPSIGQIISASDVTYATGQRGMKTQRVYGMYALVYVYAGQGHYQDTNGISTDIRAGDLIIVFPTLGHLYGPGPQESWREFYIVFDGPVFDLWQDAGLLSPDEPVLHLAPVKSWLKRLRDVVEPPLPRLEGELSKAHPARALRETTRLQSVLADALAHRIQPGQDPAIRRWAQLATTEMLKHGDPAKAADAMQMSESGFRHRFRDVVGMPPARYVATKRIERACELMQRTTLSDQQIAQQLGFCDAFHFSRRFKSLTGRSPRAFRMSLP